MLARMNGMLRGIACAAVAFGCAFDPDGGQGSVDGASATGTSAASTDGGPTSAASGGLTTEAGATSTGTGTQDSGGSTGEPNYGPFAPPERVAVINSDNANDDDPTLSADMLQIYFASDRMGADEDIWFATRASVLDDFDPPQRWEFNDNNAGDGSPKLSPDGRVLAFGSARAGNLDIWIATRGDPNGPWEAPSRIDELATDLPEGGFARTADEQFGMFCRTLVNNEIFATRWDVDGARWGEPVSVIGAEMGGNNCSVWLAPGGDELWFATDRRHENALGNNDIWAVSVVDGQPLADAAPVPEINTAASDEDPWRSPDGSNLYLASNAGGGYDIYLTSRISQ